jgi:hypothetical protein
LNLFGYLKSIPTSGFGMRLLGTVCNFLEISGLAPVNATTGCDCRSVVEYQFHNRSVAPNVVDYHISGSTVIRQVAFHCAQINSSTPYNWACAEKPTSTYISCPVMMPVVCIRNPLVGKSIGENILPNVAHHRNRWWECS